MPSHLFVCHDTGNTNNMLKTANALRAKDKNQTVTFLVVGVAAQKIFAQHSENVIELTSWLPGTSMIDLDTRALTDAEKDIVAKKLWELQPESSMVGSSCFIRALVPFQIVEILTQQKQKLLVGNSSLSADKIYVGDSVRLGNFDFFQNNLTNPLWSLVNSKWAAHISFLLAMAEEAQLLNPNEQLICHVVGSPALDDMLDTIFDENNIKRTLSQLEVENDQQLLFISGSKVIAEDLALLEALCAELKDQPQLAIRMGLHPGTPDLKSYVDALLAWLDQAVHKAFAVKIMVSASLMSKLSPKSMTHDSLYLSSLTSDQVFPAATSIASAQPATIATQGAVLGKKVYCLYAESSYVGKFFAASARELVVDKAKEQTRLTKQDLGLPAEPAVRLMSNMMLGK